MTKTFKGRCPTCLPDGGAIFDYWGEGLKRCRNCHQVTKRRQVTASGKPTRSQQRVIDRVVQLFGGVPEVTMIGRSVFLNLVNRERNMFLGDSLFGTIGPAGGFKITLQKIGDDAILTDDIGLNVYLRDPKSVKLVEVSS